MDVSSRARVDLGSYSQLVQELISGSVRRHTFTQNELELLFDLQTSRVRKGSRPELLRRYLRAVYQYAAKESGVLRLSTFLEQESTSRTANTSAAISGRQVA